VRSEKARPLWSFLRALFVAPFPRNCLWRTAQMGAYAKMGGRPRPAVVLLHLVPTWRDARGVGALASGQVCWRGGRPANGAKHDKQRQSASTNREAAPHQGE
jgi:hypothetical protein